MNSVAQLKQQTAKSLQQHNTCTNYQCYWYIPRYLFFDQLDSYYKDQPFLEHDTLEWCYAVAVGYTITTDVYTTLILQGKPHYNTFMVSLCTNQLRIIFTSSSVNPLLDCDHVSFGWILSVVALPKSHNLISPFELSSKFSTCM